MNVVECGCGRSYTLAKFRELGIPTYQDSGLPGVLVELRACECRSHRGIHTGTDEHRTYLDDAAVAKIESAGLCAAPDCDWARLPGSAWCDGHQACETCHYGAGENAHECGRCAACREFFPLAMLEDFGRVGRLCSQCYDAHPCRHELARADMYDDE